MTTRLSCGVVLLICLLAQGADLAACGDKFLSTSRGTRFQRAGLVRRPASVLVYAAPSSRLAQTLTQLDVSSALVKVGYRPTVVSDPGAMAQALRDGRWDIVLLDLDDASAVLPARTAAASPAVITVAHDATGEGLSKARRAYDGVVKKPGRARAFVDVVDDVLLARALRPTTARGSATN